MWPGWSLEVGKAGFDLGYTEAIDKRMRVPSRLQVADGGDSSSAGPQRSPLEDFPLAFRMHVPDRLLPTEMPDVAFGSIPGKQLRQQSLAVGIPLLQPTTQPVMFGEQPFLSFASTSRSQKRKRPAHHSRSRKERSSVEDPQLPPGGIHQRHEWPEPSAAPVLAPQLPPLPLEGRIYSLQNILQVLHFLGRQLFQLFWKPGQAQLSSQEPSLALESFLEESGPAEILTMRRQLLKISGRLRSLEEQCGGWRQKELLVYSVLVSACLLNVWLWLRR